MRGGRATCWRCLALALAASACGPDAVNLPTAPFAEETELVLAEYQAPSGTVDEARLAEISAQVQTRIDEVAVAWLPDLVLGVLTLLRRRFDTGGLPTDPEEPEDTDRADIEAVIDVYRVCEGWNEPPDPTDEAANGSLELTAVVDGGQLSPLLWGTASTCRATLNPIDTATIDPAISAFIDAAFSIYLYGPLPRTGAEASFWFGLSGQLGTEARMTTTSFDFRVMDQRLEFRHPVDDGDIIVGVGLSGFTLRGQNGVFECQLLTGSCAPDETFQTQTDAPEPER